MEKGRSLNSNKNNLRKGSGIKREMIFALHIYLNFFYLLYFYFERNFRQNASDLFDYLPFGLIFFLNIYVCVYLS